jgi:hypothetical protein
MSRRLLRQDLLTPVSPQNLVHADSLVISQPWRYAAQVATPIDQEASVGRGEPRSRAELVLEIIALRHQMAVLKRNQRFYNQYWCHTGLGSDTSAAGWRTCAPACTPRLISMAIALPWLVSYPHCRLSWNSPPTRSGSLFCTSRTASTQFPYAPSSWSNVLASLRSAVSPS